MTRHEIDVIQDYLIANVEQLKFPGTKLEFSYIPTSIINNIDKCPDPEGTIAQKTIVAGDITMDDIITLLTDAFAMANAFDCVDYDRFEYKAAREALIREGWKDVCNEEVQARMLMDGKSLILIETENHKKHNLTLAKIIKGMNASIDAIMQSEECSRICALCKFFEEGDFYTYEAAIQYGIFGEVVYG